MTNQSSVFGCRYSSESSHKAWLLTNLASFDTRLLDVVLSGQSKTPLSRAGVVTGQGRGGQRSDGVQCDESMRDLVVSQLSRLMTTNVILRLGESESSYMIMINAGTVANWKYEKMLHFIFAMC